MATESTATTVWQGSLTKGSGSAAPGSGAFEGQEVTWARRAEREAGFTSPEEFLALAHSSCFCMALSNELAQGGNEPERLEGTATVSFVPGEGVKSSHIVVKGRVPGIDQAQFDEAARGAGESCPISAALKGNIEISVDATLE
jgi:osmotically inducible protein OsmC